MFSKARCNANLETALLRAQAEQKFDYYEGLRQWLGDTETYRNYTAIYLALAMQGLGPGQHLRSVASRVYSTPSEVNHKLRNFERIFPLLLPINKRSATALIENLEEYLPENIAKAKDSFCKTLPWLPQPLCEDIFGTVYPDTSFRPQELGALRRDLRMITPYLPD